MKCPTPKILKNPSFYKGTWQLYATYLDSHVISQTPKSCLEVPCGKCDVCKSDAIAKQLGRLLIASYPDGMAYFVTLTIDEVHFLQNNLKGVRKDDVESLINGINRHNRDKYTHWKYYITSEYGSESDRPHYHGLFYNFRTIVDLRDCLDKYYDRGNKTYSETNLARFRYTANSHVSKCSHIPYYLDDDCLLPCNKPFVRCSRGLGHDYLEKFWRKVWKDGCLNIDGITYPLHDTIIAFIAKKLHRPVGALKYENYCRHVPTNYKHEFQALAESYGIDFGLFSSNPHAFFEQIRMCRQRDSREFNRKYINKDKNYNV